MAIFNDNFNCTSSTASDVPIIFFLLTSLLPSRPSNLGTKKKMTLGGLEPGNPAIALLLGFDHMCVRMVVMGMMMQYQMQRLGFVTMEHLLSFLLSTCSIVIRRN